MESIYLHKAKNELESGNFEEALNFITIGKETNDEACIFVNYYFSKEVKYSEKIKYFETHFDSFNLGFSFDYWVQKIVGILSPYRKEYAVANDIPLEEISNLALTDWILINKFHINKTFLKEFWNSCEKEVLTTKLRNIISSALMISIKPAVTSVVKDNPITKEKNIEEKFTFEMSNELKGYILTKCKSMDTHIEIPSLYKKKPVVEIGKSAFSRCEQLKTISIPNSIIRINDAAFFRCTSLYEVVIPDSVLSVGYGVFSECSSLKGVKFSNNIKILESELFGDCTFLTNVILPQELVEIKSDAFRKCIRLNKVIIPDKTMTIESFAFRNCENLNTVMIPGNVKEIGSYAFSKCTNLHSLSIGEGVEKIGRGAFSECIGLTCVTIPSTVGTIEKYTFEKCSGIRNVEISHGVSVIEDDAFSDCESIESITLPATIKSIGNSAFYRTYKLREINYQGSKKEWKKISMSYNAFVCSSFKKSMIKFTK